MTAGVTAVGQEELTFLTISKDLADAKTGTKLKGKLSWPFTLGMPSETGVAERPKAKPELYRLPPTFTGVSASARLHAGHSSREP